MPPTDVNFFDLTRDVEEMAEHASRDFNGGDRAAFRSGFEQGAMRMVGLLEARDVVRRTYEKKSLTVPARRSYTVSGWSW